MTDAFRSAFDRLVKVEGGYSDDARDSGGRTMLGITEAVARANGYVGEMRDLSIDDAALIYRRQYWDTLRLDSVAALSVPIAEELFDTGVNMGIGVAGKFLQRALNALNNLALNNLGAIYTDLTVDGIVGPGTVAALQALLTKRGGSGEVVLLRALNALQGARYIELAEARQKDEAFVFGWLLHRVKI